MADRIDTVQLNSFVGQKPQSPSGIPFRSLTTPEGNEPCLSLSVQLEWSGRMLLLFTTQRRFKPFFYKALPNVLHRRHMDRKGLRYRFICP